MITLRNKIGQMLVMGFNGAELNEHSPVVRWLSDDGLGGVLLFDKDVSTDTYGKNLKNSAQIKQLIHQLNRYSMQCFAEEEHCPLLVALDYEGGVVDRLTKIDGCMATMRPCELAKLPLHDFNEEVAQMASTLKSLGFNLNFAPVVDLNLNDQEGIIGKLGRSFSDNPEVVSQVARQFVSVFSRYGIGCCYKHFPGHGSAIGDTHEGFVDVTDTFSDDELAPYRTLLKDNDKPVMVMTAHVVNRALDSKGLPATLSHEILTGILRQTLGYDGIIISDDLQMQAIAKHYSLKESLALTINAGADMVIFANQLNTHSATEVIDCIEQLVLEQRIDVKRIDDAFRRIKRFKQQISTAELVSF
ncbi:glycoside hydrolase family 3 protein [Legionella worsleiensis]|uniref:beta-N-acetylhexosaminidase n=1 Tax=Legionella worsleiensis TaxID=45076 RepID=A0A0W1A3S8_9GAMM|nr:glycoside hydrolase family 3 N-terminal domain-containing protein [Legionella worsleiensis]KTD76005.1 glycosyl hydrolase [Legionella worsleiensis]STY33018.1 beta-N-acetylhexosaminidase [Legionella worsleiensis]